MLRSPSTVQVRVARPTDAEALARVFKESWTLAYTGILPPEHLARFVRKRDADWWAGALKAGEQVLVLDIEGTLAGYATFGTSRARNGKYQGEIYELYLAPVYQGLGLGEHLFEGCRHHLDARGLRGLIVWALVDNPSACHFYWRRGGRPIASVHERFGQSRLEKAAFGWP